MWGYWENILRIFIKCKDLKPKDSIKNVFIIQIKKNVMKEMEIVLMVQVMIETLAKIINILVLTKSVPSLYMWY